MSIILTLSGKEIVLSAEDGTEIAHGDLIQSRTEPGCYRELIKWRDPRSEEAPPPDPSNSVH